MDLDECLEKGYLVKESPAKDLVDKELKESEYDFKRAEIALKDLDYKWAIIKSYYSMFHSAKAICFKLGYREKRHVATLIILEYLNKEGKLEIKYINDFKAAISARESADYRYTYTKENASLMTGICKEFNKRILKLLERL